MLNLLRKFKLKSRLLISFSLILVLSISIATLALTGLQNANKELNNFIDHAFAADTAVKMCRIEVNIAARNIREMVIDADKSTIPAYVETINSNIESIRGNIDTLKKTYTKEDGLVTKYESSLNSWIAIGEKIIATMEDGKLRTAQDMILN